MALSPRAREKLSEIVGKGWKFPFSFNELGGVSTQDSKSESDAVELINQSIRQILGTAVGERVIRRSFGSLLFTLVDENIDQFLQAEIRRNVFDAIETHERRVILQESLIDFTNRDGGMVSIAANYQIIKSQRSGNLVFPFYLTTNNFPLTL